MVGQRRRSGEGGGAVSERSERGVNGDWDGGC